MTAPKPEAPTLDAEYPNLTALAQGCMSGQFSEWPQLKVEADKILERLRAIENAKGMPVPIEFRRFRGALKPADRGAWINGPSNFYSASEVDYAIDALRLSYQHLQDRLNRMEALLRDDKRPDPLGDALNSGDGSYRP